VGRSGLTAGAARGSIVPDPRRSEIALNPGFNTEVGGLAAKDRDFITSL
jgi:hypothetical protein